MSKTRSNPDSAAKASEGADSADPYTALTSSGPPSPSLLYNFNDNDIGNAQRILAVHGRNLIYCPQYRRFLTWTGSRWELDDADSNRAFALAQSAMEAYHSQAV